MALADFAIRNTKFAEKSRKLADGGGDWGVRSALVVMMCLFAALRTEAAPACNTFDPAVIEDLLNKWSGPSDIILIGSFKRIGEPVDEPLPGVERVIRVLTPYEIRPEKVFTKPAIRGPLTAASLLRVTDTGDLDRIDLPNNGDGYLLWLGPIQSKLAKYRIYRADKCPK